MDFACLLEVKLIVKSQVFADQSKVFLENNFNGCWEIFDKNKQKLIVSSIDTFLLNCSELREQIKPDK